MRDIHKQWYISGINERINTPEKLLEFLKQETDGFEVVTIGSSAGGYAAILYGCLLNAKYIYAFSPQVELQSLYRSSNENMDPIVFRVKDSYLNRYFELANYILNSNATIFYFSPIHSKWDKVEYQYILKEKINTRTDFNIILFNTSKHGVPFPKICLQKILSAPDVLSKFYEKNNHPLIFSIKLVGIKQTIMGSYIQFKKYFHNKFCNKK